MTLLPCWLFNLILIGGTFGGALLYDHGHHLLGMALATSTIFLGGAYTLWWAPRIRPRLKPPLDGGLWAEDDLRRAFVRGATWWEYHQTHATMWPSDRTLAEAEAERRYPGGDVPEDRRV